MTAKTSLQPCLPCQVSTTDTVCRPAGLLMVTELTVCVLQMAA